jgi:hypothetical protein
VRSWYGFFRHHNGVKLRVVGAQRRLLQQQLWPETHDTNANMLSDADCCAQAACQTRAKLGKWRA